MKNWLKKIHKKEKITLRKIKQVISQSGGDPKHYIIKNEDKKGFVISRPPVLNKRKVFSKASLAKFRKWVYEIEVLMNKTFEIQWDDEMYEELDFDD